MKFTSCTLIAVACFALSLSPVHSATVAYWRFEAGPAGAPVPHPTAAGAFYGSVDDVSGNGNELSAWTQGSWAGFAYRSDVASTWVPQSGASNSFSVQNTGPYPTMFTSAVNSSPSGINADTMTPEQFTIEASYKAQANGGYRTIVGRDARNVSTSNGDLAALYLQVRPDDSVRILFTDVSGYSHEAFSPPGWVYGFDASSDPSGTNAPWYHVAGVSDGSTLKLYVNNVLMASTDLTASGSPNRSLAIGTTSGTDWTAGAWSVGRGLYAGGHTDRAYGFIDEVRISNTALTPGELLFAPRPEIVSLPSPEGRLTLNAIRGQPGALCYVLESTNPNLPPNEWTTATARSFDTNGYFSWTKAVDPTSPPRFFLLKAPIQPPPPGAMSYSLAGNWPADARARIIYAMDGAVAEYNRYGRFNKHVTANYNPGVPTAQASYSGWIDFGSNSAYQNFRTALHEISHTLGVGTISQWNANLSGGVWIGANGAAEIQKLDGPGAVIHSDGTHFWPYGLNYDSEGNTESYRRHVLMVAAFRKDMGIQ